ncbi:MAG: CASTOR/POLLUX-related putative ion channel [bacterium]
MATVSRSFTFRQRLRYRFDNSLARGIWGVLALLGLLAVALFLVVALFIQLSGIGPGGEPTTFPEAVWYALPRSLDPGTVSGDEGLGFRLIMLFVTLVGILLAAAIIGLVSSAIDRRLETLRRGRSLVVEEGHTLILGASDKLIPVIGELVEANASERDRAIVVLSPADVVELSDDIRGAIPDLQTTRLVIRSGNPARLQDLRQANPATAKSIIILNSGSDAQVVKAALGVLRSLPDDAPARVVAELEDPEIAASLASAAGPRLLTVTSSHVVGLIGAQVARAPGLGTIYQDLLDFDGDEIYMTAVTPTWQGRSFGEALLASARGTIVGIRSADGSTALAPDPATVLGPGDLLIGICEDDSSFALDTAPVEWRPSDERAWVPEQKERERTLVIGWSPLAPLIAQELDVHVAPDSEIHLLANERDDVVEAIRTAISLDHQRLTVHLGDPIQRAVVQDVLAAGPFNHVILLSEAGLDDAEEADARTMLTLLHVHALSREGGPVNVVAELLDPNDVELSGSADNQDFIVSQRLVALLLAQLSENPSLDPVFADIFDAGGASLWIQPAIRYVAPGDVTFRDIIEAGRAWGVVPIGYRAASQVGSPGTIGAGIRVNPPKDDVVTLGEGDSVIVIDRHGKGPGPALQGRGHST